MEELKPTEMALKELGKLFNECWKEISNNTEAKRLQSENDIKRNEAEIERYLNLIETTQSNIVRTRYETKIESMAHEIALLKEKRTKTVDLRIPYQTTLDSVLQLAKNPYELWDSTDLEFKKTIYYFFFEDNILFDMKTGYRTPKPSILYEVLEDLEKNSIKVDTLDNFSNSFPQLVEFIEKWNSLINNEKSTDKRLAA